MQILNSEKENENPQKPKSDHLYSRIVMGNCSLLISLKMDMIIVIY